jgi:Ca-activated chloride channel family protein
LADKPAPSGRDWAELARETVSWGQQLQTAQQPVPAGPVHDALAAVDAGAKLDPATADWPQLRQELEALLTQTGEPPPQEPPPEPQPQDQEQPQDNQDQSPQDQSQQSPAGENPDQSPPQPNEPQPSDQNSGEPSPEQKGAQKNQQAFGDMQEKAPPPKPGEMQQVGGEQSQEKPADPAALDPALAMPLQKLEQIRDRDSPAQLFQLLEGKPASDQPSSGKQW